MFKTFLLGVLVLFPTLSTAQTTSAPSAGDSATTIALPSGGQTNIAMDYIGYDPKTGFVWVPAGNTGAVDVVDTANGSVKQVSGFPTSEVQANGGAKRIVGPSSVAVGDGSVYIGSRGDSSVCSVNQRTLARGACGHLDKAPDGIVYVVPTKEVWVTTPADLSVRILDGTTLAEKAKITFEGRPEGYAVDAKRGRFYMNYEDKDRTVAVDLKTHKILATWNPSCGKDGPHGIALDEKAGYLLIACSTRSLVMDVGHDGAILSSVDTGDGVDNLDYNPATHLLYVGAAKAALLTIARVDNAGKLSVVSQIPIPSGARNGVIAKNGTVYLGHGGASQMTSLVAVPTGER